MDKIVLIRPKFARFLQANPPLGLGYLAAVLEKNGYEVLILDCNVFKITNQKLVDYLIKIKPLLIGITTLTTYFAQMKELSNLIKSTNELKNVTVALGGVHVTFLPVQSLLECNADFIVMGEGEFTLLELTNAIKTNKPVVDIKGIAYRKNNDVIVNEPRQLIENLDDIPFPAWHLIPPKTYPRDPQGHEYIRAPFAPIVTTRGCPYRCRYCASTNFWSNKLRRRSPKNVVDEIEFLMKEFGVREIHIWDDNFTFIKSHVIQICDEIIKRKLDLKFKLPSGVRIDSLDDLILFKMKQAGFYHLVLAIESGSQKLLDSMNKQLDLKKIPKTVKLIKKYSFLTKGFFILGLPGETINTCHSTIRYAKKLGFDFLTIFFAQPIPGSDLFCDWKKNIDLDNYNWENIEFASGVSLSDVSPKILKKFRNRTYISVLFSPQTLYVFLSHPRFGINYASNIIRVVLRRIFR